MSPPPIPAARPAAPTPLGASPPPPPPPHCLLRTLPPTLRPVPPPQARDRHVREGRANRCVKSEIFPHCHARASEALRLPETAADAHQRRALQGRHRRGNDFPMRPVGQTRGG